MTKKSQHKRENRREMALSRKEAQDRRKFMMAFGGLGFLVAAILIAGIVYSYLLQPNQAVAEVNGEKITRQDYQKRVLYERYLLDEQATFVQLQLQQLSQSLKDSPELLKSLESQANQQLNQIANQRIAVDRDALDLLIEEKLVLAEAAKEGLRVSDEEIQAAYENIAAARQGGYTEAAAAETVAARKKATATAALFTPTPTLSATSAITPQPTLPPQPTPTINVIKGGDLSQATADWEKAMSEKVTMSPEDLRHLVYAQLMREKLYESLGEEINAMQLQVHARHILLESVDEARAVRQRLENGEAFEDVAAEASTDPGSGAQGGDLGWFPRRTMVPEFDEAAFSLPIGQISDPIHTQFGWHIIEVLAREDRELDENGLSRERTGAYNDWLDEAKASGIEDFWVPDDAPEDENNPFVRQ